MPLSEQKRIQNLTAEEYAREVGLSTTGTETGEHVAERQRRERLQTFAGKLEAAPPREPTASEIQALLPAAQRFVSLHPQAFGDERYKLFNLQAVMSFLEERQAMPSASNLEQAYQHLAPQTLWLVDASGRVFAPGAAMRELGAAPWAKLMSPVEEKRKAEDLSQLSADELKARIEKDAPMPDSIRVSYERAYEGWISARSFKRRTHAEYEEVRSQIFNWLNENHLVPAFQHFDVASAALVAAGELTHADESLQGVHKVPGFTYTVHPPQSAKPVHDQRPVVIEENKLRKFSRTAVMNMSADEFAAAMANDKDFVRAVNEMGQSD